MKIELKKEHKLALLQALKEGHIESETLDDLRDRHYDGMSDEELEAHVRDIDRKLYKWDSVKYAYLKDR